MNKTKLERCPMTREEAIRILTESNELLVQQMAQLSELIGEMENAPESECQSWYDSLDHCQQEYDAVVFAIEHLSRAPLPDNKANILPQLEMFFGRGVLGVASVAANESAPIREILIYQLPDPVLPIGSNLGDKGKHVEELENVLVRMHFERAESAHVLERAIRCVLDSFEAPDNKALTRTACEERAAHECKDCKSGFYMTNNVQHPQYKWCPKCGRDLRGESHD